MRPTGAKRREKGGGVVLTVTSLVDILSILLIFLLMSFSPEGALLQAAQDLELPETTSREGIAASDRVIAVTGSAVTVGNRVAARLDRWDGTLPIAGLAALLGDVSSTPEADRRVLIQGDRRIPFDLLYAVLFTSHQAGYKNLALAAYEQVGEEGGSPQ